MSRFINTRTRLQKNQSITIKPVIICVLYSQKQFPPSLAVFILEDALSVWTNLGKHLLLDALCVSSIKTGTRRIIRLDELSSVVRRSRRTTEDSSSRRIMRLVPVFILETHNASDNKCLPKFVQTDNASSSIKTAITEKVRGLHVITDFRPPKKNMRMRTGHP